MLKSSRFALEFLTLSLSKGEDEWSIRVASCFDKLEP
jgi:hypothetical protein